MRFEGIHHVTCITGDAPGNVDFYTRVLGLRMVKKTVNQDDPTVYHLFYADEEGSPGADITFFEYPGARRGRAGAGHGAHDHVPRRRRGAALDFWEARLARGGRRDAAERRTRSASTTPRGSGSSSPSTRPATRRSSPRPRDPGRARPPGLRRRARLLRRPGGEPRGCSRTTLGFAPTGRGCLGGARQRPRRPLRLRPAARLGRRRPGRRHRAPRRLVVEHGRAARRGCDAVARRGLPRERRRSTGSGSARSTSASRAACCSRSPRSGPASRSTRIPTTSARR